MSVPTTLKEAIKRQVALREHVEQSFSPEAADQIEARKEPHEGGRLEEAQSLVYWWMLDPVEACRVVGFPIEQYRPPNGGNQEPAYMPSPKEIERLSQRIRSGALVLGTATGKLFVNESDDWDGDETEPDDWR